ncbi:AAA family ATPase [Aureimonas frigidaquae]|uniref:AAA family ATPase n=1 Tax=Aureimonas frigidaquae TaxID=424757 RepID=UPI0007849FE0|nr:hypothetical protein [Aureimonas frigidaquae]
MPSAGNSQEHGAYRGAAVPRLPALLLHAFCDDERIAAAIQRAAQTPTAGQLTVRVRPGGIAAACRHYADRPTPHLLILQSDAGPHGLLEALDTLADHCDPETKVVVVGAPADADLTRELMRRGISAFLPLPVSPADIVLALSRIVPAERGVHRPRMVAFMGARGGAGSSVLAQNLAFLSARLYRDRVVLADLDPAFGSGALNLDLSRQQGQLVSRGENFNLITLPQDWQGDASDRRTAAALATARRAAELVFLDLPHGWNPLVRDRLAEADAIVITATPDLQSLNNLANLLDALESLERVPPRPQLILNQMGLSAGADLPIGDFVEPGRIDLLAAIPFSPRLFATATRRGQLLAEVNDAHPLTRVLERVTHSVTGRTLSVR